MTMTAEKIAPLHVGALTLSVDRAVASAQLPAPYGLDWTTFSQQWQVPTMHAVQKLVADSTAPGAWSKWLNLGNDTGLADTIMTYAQSVQGQFDAMVVLGIGGSSLGGIALLNALLHPHWNLLSAEQRQGRPRFHFVDNVDGDSIAGLLDVLNLSRTLVVVISKSGNTAETMSAFLWLVQALRNQGLNDAQLSRQIVAVTDERLGILRPLVDAQGWMSFPVPDDVGGRFSVFSAVGLLPAALCGIDIRAMQTALCEAQEALSVPALLQNPAALGAALQVAFYQQGKPISVMMPYSQRLRYVSDWYVQLWAESLGKKTNTQGETVNIGPTPVRAVGVTDQHSQVQLFNEGPHDKVFTFIEVAKPEHAVTIPEAFPGLTPLNYLVNQRFDTLMGAEFEATRAALTQHQRPSVTITLDAVTPASVAQLLFFLEVQTAIAGHLLGIDPFDQPGVEWAKKATQALMGEPSQAHLIAQIRGV